MFGNFTRKKTGKLDVVCGSMFSGKTEELIRRLRRATIAELKTQIFKHRLDDRVTTECLHSHGGDKIPAIAVSSARMIKELLCEDTQVVGIDEVQFFPTEGGIVEIIQELVASGRYVVVAGLDLDFRGVPFGCMPTLLALADSVIKFKAICVVCRGDAHFTQRIIDGKPAHPDDPIILVGAQESYQARCRACYESGLEAFVQSMPGKSCVLNS